MLQHCTMTLQNFGRTNFAKFGNSPILYLSKSTFKNKPYKKVRMAHVCLFSSFGKFGHLVDQIHVRTYKRDSVINGNSAKLLY